MSTHLSVCEPCRRQLESAMPRDAAFFALRSQVLDEDAQGSLPLHAHLTSEQLTEYVDRDLVGERLRIAADHLVSCEQCALAVGDLSTFKNEVAASLDREYQPASAATVSEGWWRRTVASLWSPFSVSSGMAFGTAVAILLLGVTGWLILRALREQGRQEIVVAPAPSLTPAPVVSPGPQSEPSPSQPESEAVVAELSDGDRQLKLDREGKLSGVDELPVAYQSLLKKALTTGRIERSSQLEGLARPSSALMGSENQKEKFSVIEPVGNVLMTDRPTFRWSPLTGATGYVVEIYDSKFKLVATSPPLTAQTWVLPQSLSGGGIYSWQVKASKDGEEIASPRPPTPQAKFRILDRAKTNELAKARRAYGSSHLTLALLYADAGLLNESEQELRKLQKANPDSELARNLLHQVQALRLRPNK